MASSSGRRSSSSARSSNRRRVVIAGEKTRDVQYDSARLKATNSKSPRASGGSSSRRAASHPKTAADRASNNKRLERERRLRAQRLRTQLMFVAAVLAVGLVVFGAYSLYRSSVFEILSVDVVGSEGLSDETVLEIIDLPEGATLLRYPGQEIQTRLEQEPWIESASLSRDFPETLRVRITERTPVALVDAGGLSLWLVDANGVVIEQHTPDATLTVTVIRDVEGLDPIPGRKTLSEALLNALDVMEGLSPELRARVRAISAPSIDKTSLITHEDIEIFIGSADELDKKDRVARQILEEQVGEVVYINVRTVDRPTWRGLGDE